MGYQKFFDLKFKAGLNTVELECLFPRDKQKICEVSMLELPDKTLRKCVSGKTYKKLKILRGTFLERHR